MGFFKKVFKPVRKIAKKIIPKELRPFLPYAAAMIPGAQGLASLSFMNPAAQKALFAGLTSAATDEDGNPLRAAALAAAPDLISGGVGKLSGGTGPVANFLNKGRAIGDAGKTSSIARGITNALNPESPYGQAKLLGGQTAVDQSAKFAEIRQDEIDEYNRNLLEQGVASKVDRRKAIFGIYQNAGYEEDYINTMLDTYGYADGGRIGYAGGGFDIGKAESLASARSIDDILPKRKPISDIEVSEDDDVTIDENGKIKVKRKPSKSDMASGLASAMNAVQTAYGRPFGEMEPVPMMRFARGGEVEVEEQTEDLGIMDLMRDQGVEYGEQVSNAQNDELLEKLFEEFIDLGFSPEDAAKKAREAFDDMSQGQGIKGTQVASGYKDDIEEMYEQYVFEMEEQGLQPMDFAAFLRQAQSGMAGGGRVNMKVGGILKAGMKGISKLKTMVVTKLSRMTDDVELRGNTDYADDTGLDFTLDVTAKSKKGKKVLNELADEGLVEKLDDTNFFINNSQRDAIGEMKGLKASGMVDEGTGYLKGPAKRFTRFDQGAGDSGLGPYGGYDEVIDTFYKKAEGGIMNRNLLNTGMDKDMRGGGFIPEGTKEKADDVPARLSKNEFVMTADAVRAAGGGSVNQGAKRMYETMHKLEAKV